MNGLGAKFSYEGMSYIVRRVQASSQVASVNICMNDECVLKFQPYPLSTADCVNCRAPLVTKTVLRPDLVYAEPVRRFGETYAEVVSLPSFVGGGTWRAWKSLTVPAEIAYGRVDCVTLTPAFMWTGRGNRTHQPSEVPVPSSKEPPAGKALSVLGKKEIQVEFGHPGYRFETLGFAVKIALEDARKAFGRKVFGGIVSFQQAARLASSIAADSELEDVDALWSLERGSVVVYVVDSKTRGSGVTKKVFEGIGAEGDRFFSAVKEIARCPHCTKYCSRCLLVARTPPHYLQHGLLDRTLVQRILG